jgi:hypothetical protein
MFVHKIFNIATNQVYAIVKTSETHDMMAHDCVRIKIIYPKRLRYLNGVTNLTLLHICNIEACRLNMPLCDVFAEYIGTS